MRSCMSSYVHCISDYLFMVKTHFWEISWIKRIHSMSLFLWLWCCLVNESTSIGCTNISSLVSIRVIVEPNKFINRNI